MRRLTFVLCFLLFAVNAQADPILVNANGTLTGVRNLNVGGVLYDVAFIDDHCILLTTPAVFGCNKDTFDYSLNYSDGLLGMQALMDVFTSIPYGPIYGCVVNIHCLIYLPVRMEDWVAGVALLTLEVAPGSVGFGGLSSLRVIDCCNLEANAQRSTFLKFTPVVDTPEPSTLLLLICGSLMVVYLRWTARRQSLLALTKS